MQTMAKSHPPQTIKQIWNTRSHFPENTRASTAPPIKPHRTTISVKYHNSRNTLYYPASHHAITFLPRLWIKNERRKEGYIALVWIFSGYWGNRRKQKGIRATTDLRFKKYVSSFLVGYGLLIGLNGLSVFIRLLTGIDIGFLG